MPPPLALQGVPPMALLLGLSALLIAGAYVGGSGAPRPHPLAGPQPVSVGGVLAALLRAAAPRLHAAVGAFLPIKWSLWQDVAVFTMVGAMATAAAGPHFEQHRLWAAALPHHPLVLRLREGAAQWTL